MKTIRALKIAAVFLAIAIISAGCNKSQHEPAISQQYQVDFIKNDSSAIVMAWFTVDNSGRNVRFDDRSRVTANGLTDSGIYATDQTFFSWKLAAANEVAFTFRKNDNTFTNRISTSDIDDISLVIDTVLFVSDTMRVSFIGSAIKEGEYVGMSMNRNSDSTNLWSGISAQFSGSQCTLDFSQTRDFHPGVYTVLLSRKKTVPLQQADKQAGGSIDVSITDGKTVVIR